MEYNIIVKHLTNNLILKWDEECGRDPNGAPKEQAGIWPVYP
ncbi:MAG: hypothetical protein PWP75_1186 [Caldanaerobacter sp.]|nr:hypothetical protein [Caldanaerobacter sp.]